MFIKVSSFYGLKKLENKLRNKANRLTTGILLSVPLHRQELTLEPCLLVQSENLYTCHPVSGDAPW